MFERWLSGVCVLWFLPPANPHPLLSSATQANTGMLQNSGAVQYSTGTSNTHSLYMRYGNTPGAKPTGVVNRVVQIWGLVHSSSRGSPATRMVLSTSGWQPTILKSTSHSTSPHPPYSSAFCPCTLSSKTIMECTSTRVEGPSVIGGSGV